MMSFLQAVGVLPFLFLAAFTAGLALAPAAHAYQVMTSYMVSWTPGWHYAGIGIAMALSYMVYGFSLILIAPLVNLLLGGRCGPGAAGGYPPAHGAGACARRGPCCPAYLSSTLSRPRLTSLFTTD